MIRLIELILILLVQLFDRRPQRWQEGYWRGNTWVSGHWRRY